ncbi:MAG: cyanophycinase [Bacteroidales bacterium]|nr:cyanophycinase [Bacteroidales bacterium]
MKNQLISLLFLLLLLFIPESLYSEVLDSSKERVVTTGPQNGSLVVVGGAMRDTNIVLKFIELAGGKDAAIVIVPTAMGVDSVNPARVSGFLTRLGATNVQIVHTNNPELANTEKFVKPIKNANAIWFSGGRQWRIVDAYANTLAEKEFQKVLERGGVIGGSSAGATIQGSYLARGDTKTNRIMMGDHQEGFGYLKNSAIDQHLLVRNRQFDLIEILNAHPELLGIGLDENTAIVVKGDELEVIGKSFVAIYDTQFWKDGSKTDNKPVLPNGGKFFLLRAGDKYNMNTRKVIHWQGTNRGISIDKDIK